MRFVIRLSHAWLFNYKFPTLRGLLRTHLLKKSVSCTLFID